MTLILDGIPSAMMRDILKALAPFMSSDTERPILCSIQTTSDGMGMTGLTATDGYRLATTTLLSANAVSRADDQHDVMWPAKLVKDLIRTLPPKGEVEVTINADHHRGSDRVEVTHLWSRQTWGMPLVCGTFPSVQSIVAEARQIPGIQCDLNELIDGLKQMAATHSTETLSLCVGRSLSSHCSGEEFELVNQHGASIKLCARAIPEHTRVRGEPRINFKFLSAALSSLALSARVKPADKVPVTFRWQPSTAAPNAPIKKPIHIALGNSFEVVLMPTLSIGSDKPDSPERLDNPWVARANCCPNGNKEA